MAELKTKKTKASVAAFLAKVPASMRADAKALCSLMQKATREKPVMWGPSIVGFGSYHYKYASGREGDWMLTGFSPRKGNLTVYIMPGFKNYTALLKKLGKHKISGGSCVYIQKLSDVDQTVLMQLVKQSVKDMNKQSAKK